MSSVKNIMVIDDHQLFLEGISHVLLDCQPDAHLDLLSSVDLAITKIEDNAGYDLVFVDLNLPGLNGFAFLNALLNRNIFVPVIVLSASRDLGDIQRAMSIGASGYLCKDADSKEMQLAIKQVLDGEIYLPDDVWFQLDAYPAVRTQVKDDHANPLSKRQAQVFELICDGASNKQIATILNVQETTIKYHISEMFKRFFANNRTTLIKNVRRSLSTNLKN